jgi:tellurium resistance protein TerD
MKRITVWCFVRSTEIPFCDSHYRKVHSVNYNAPLPGQPGYQHPALTRQAPSAYPQGQQFASPPQMGYPQSTAQQHRPAFAPPRQRSGEVFKTNVPVSLTKRGGSSVFSIGLSWTVGGPGYRQQMGYPQGQLGMSQQQFAQPGYQPPTFGQNPHQQAYQGQPQYGQPSVHQQFASNQPASPYDLDLFALRLVNGRVRSNDDIVYFNDRFTNDGAMILTEDNTTGNDANRQPGQKDDEVLTVNTTKLKPEETILLLADIYDAENRNQTFGDLADAYMRVSHGTPDNIIGEYDLNDDSFSGTAVSFGAISFGSDPITNQPGWFFTPMGQTLPGDIAPLLGQYGVQL